jgi:hypothetical protein
LLGVLAVSTIMPIACGDDGGSSSPGDASSGGTQAGESGSPGQPSGGKPTAGSSSGGNGQAGSVAHAGAPNDGGMSSGGTGSEPMAGAGNPSVEGGTTSGGAGTGGDSAAGAAGSGGEPAACRDVIENAGCADANAATVDGQSAVFGGCVHINQVSPGVGWIAYESFGVDIASGLAFAQKGNTTSDHDGIAAACAGLTVQGIGGWRLPTIDEARLLAGGCAPTATGGSCQLSDPSCLGKDCGFASPACESCVGGQGPHKTKDYCRPEVPLCLNLTTSSACPDCATSGYWTYGVINGNFYSAAPASSGFIICVKADVPQAVPCGL